MVIFAVQLEVFVIWVMFAGLETTGLVASTPANMIFGNVASQVPSPFLMYARYVPEARAVIELVLLQFRISTPAKVVNRYWYPDPLPLEGDKIEIVPSDLATQVG
jgi:hypothetical protein